MSLGFWYGCEGENDHVRIGTTWLLLLAVCLAGAMYWWTGGAEEAILRHREEVARAFAVRPERVTALVLDRDDLRIECRRIEGVWRIVAPVNARANAAEMDRMLTVLGEMRRGEVITANERRDAGLTLADYGLERPAARIEWSDGVVWRRLRIGRPAPVGNVLYVMLEDSEDILAVPNTLLNVWPDSVVSLRDRILFHGDPRRVYRAEVRRAGGFLQLQRGEDGVWRIHQPLAAKADAVAVHQWIDRLFELRIVEFMADVIADPSVYGLDDSATQVAIWTEGQPGGQTLWLGVPIDAQSDWVYARRHEGDSVFAVSADALLAGRVRPSDLRNRTLLPFGESAIARIEISKGSEQVKLEHDGAAWQIRGSRYGRAEQAHVEALVAAWVGARIERFVDAPASHEAYAGITPDSMRVRFSVPDPAAAGAALQWRDIEFVVSDMRLPDGGLLIGRDQDASMYEVAADLMAVTTANGLHYRDRSIFMLDRTSVIRIHQTILEQETILLPNGSGRLILQPPVNGMMDSNSLSRVVDTLLTLRADEFLVDQPEEWARYGLEDPAVSWFLRLDADAGIGRSLRIGHVRPDGRAYARTLGHNTLFLLSSRDTEVLTQPLVRPVAVLPVVPQLSEDDPDE